MLVDNNQQKVGQVFDVADKKESASGGSTKQIKLQHCSTAK